MPGRLRWYIVAVGFSGLLTLVVLVPTIDPDRVRQVAQVAPDRILGRAEGGAQFGGDHFALAA